MSSITRDHLSLQDRVRLQATFRRWEKNPGLYTSEIEGAQKAYELAETHGWTLCLDRRGVPVATKPEPMRLSKPELARFKARLATLTDPDEIQRTRAAISACEFRGFTAKVNSQGQLTAIPPKQVDRAAVDVAAEQMARREFVSRTGGQTCFKKAPTKII